MVAVEAAPFAKVGGLGDFSSALTRYLSQAGEDVRLFLPAYGSIDWTDLEVGEVDFLQDISLDLGSRTLRFSVLYSYLPGTSVRVYLIHCPELYDRPSVYTDSPDEALRFAFLSRATIESCQRMGWSPDVFHCNDWHTSLLPIYLRSTYGWDSLFGPSRTMLTIHNIGYQGVFGADVIEQVGLESAIRMFPRDDLEADRVNSLKTGILHADLITTVSPTHAREIQTPEYGMGLEGLLHQRADRLVGVLNGVDYEEWDPAHDELLPRNYTPDDLRGKALNKRRLLKEVSLPFIPRTPLVGMVSRLVQQKGIELMPDVLPGLLEQQRFQLVVLGSGESAYEDFFVRLTERFPDRVFFYRGYHNELAHRIEAASDIYLMPSLYEPCGLNQMYSLRYGAVPVVRKTGGAGGCGSALRPEEPQGDRISVRSLRGEGVSPLACRGPRSLSGSSALASIGAQWDDPGFLLGAAGRQVCRALWEAGLEPPSTLGPDLALGGLVLGFEVGDDLRIDLSRSDL